MTTADDVDGSSSTPSLADLGSARLPAARERAVRRQLHQRVSGPLQRPAPPPPLWARRRPELEDGFQGHLHIVTVFCTRTRPQEQSPERLGSGLACHDRWPSRARTAVLARPRLAWRRRGTIHGLTMEIAIRHGVVSRVDVPVSHRRPSRAAVGLDSCLDAPPDCPGAVRPSRSHYEHRKNCLTVCLD